MQETLALEERTHTPAIFARANVCLLTNNALGCSFTSILGTFPSVACMSV